jgi:hypothetical protein
VQASAVTDSNEKEGSEVHHGGVIVDNNTAACAAVQGVGDPARLQGHVLVPTANVTEAIAQAESEVTDDNKDSGGLL